MQTLLHQNQNSYHYYVSLDLDPKHTSSKKKTPHNTPQELHTPYHQITFKKYYSSSKRPHASPHNHSLEYYVLNMCTTIPRSPSNPGKIIQNMINTLSTCIEETCLDKQILCTLPYKARQQGGFVPHKQEKNVEAPP